MRRALLGAALCASLALSACTRRPAPDETGLTLAALPSDVQQRLDVELDGSVQLLGATLSPRHGLKPGTRVELTLYWRKTASLDAGFRLFTHVLDEAGERILNLDGNGPLRKVVAGKPVLEPSDWDDDKIYVDKQAFTVPATLRTDSISVVAGLYRGEERLAVTRGEHVGDRALVTRLAVKRPPPAGGAVPLIWVPRRRAEWPLVIDGKLDDLSWSHAATSRQFVNVASGEPQSGGDVTGYVKLLYDEQSLYLGFEVYDEDLRGGFDPQQSDPHLWLKDTVEIMVDPDGEGDNLDYYEIQVGPQNLVFDSHFDAYNAPVVAPHGPFGHQEWSARLQSAVQLRGTLDDQLEDEGYVVELAIPWASFHKAKRVPPKPQDTWRMNFYAIENNGGAAWSPVLGQGNFHKASRFGRVRFAR